MRSYRLVRAVPWLIVLYIGASAFFMTLVGCQGPSAGMPIANSPDAHQDAADGGPSASAAQHNLETLNRYRAMAGVAPLVLDSKLNAFAEQGSVELAAGGAAHQHFSDAAQDNSLFSSGFCNGAAENQAPGWPVDPDENGTIDAALQTMMAEGPGGGHHDNIVDPNNHLLGVGLVVQSGQLYLTNDFSPACN